MLSHTCRLWIDATVNIETVQAALLREIDDQFGGVAVACDLDRNEGFDPRRPDKTDFIATSPWTAWLEAVRADEPAVDAFQAGVCRMISRLRAQGFLVTAACDFEDRVIAETGWNWTVDRPHPPG